jgi:bifunctional UDP-N-acetylglucosamine pyrophosphorylase / glucosamine-1-phosphate N-acetyltransferase
VVASPSTEQGIRDAIYEQFDSSIVQLAIQNIPRGTGDAVRSAIETLDGGDNDRILVLSGDTPLLEQEDLRPLLHSLEKETVLSFMSFLADEPTGYGRVIRGEDGSPFAIVEQRDLKDAFQHAVREVNAGVYLGRLKELRQALLRLNNDNAQGEFYLTDIVASIALMSKVGTVQAKPAVLAGVNDRSQLNHVEQLIFARIRQRFAQSGVSIVGEPLIDDTVAIAPDARIESGVRLRGKTTIGAGTLIDVGTVVTDAQIASHVHIKPYCVVTESHVGAYVQLGPFAHLRPGSVIEEEAHIGNFVETKNSLVRRGAKANHLAYLGDAEVGERSNLGAGTIVCNYDGFMKRRTVIGPDVFVGSDSQLIAPLTIGAGAYVATGTTVTGDVPAGALAIGRVRQTSKEGYAGPLRDKLRAQAQLEKTKNHPPKDKTTP